MEDKTPPSLTTGLPAASADTLRTLQERARNALAAQRARMGQLEVKLAEQLDLIEGAVAEQLSTQADQSQLFDQSSFEIEELRRSLAEAQAALSQEQAQAAADGASRSQLLEKQRAELDAHTEELTLGRRDLESRQQALDDRATQLNARERELRKLQEELDGRSQDCVRQQSQIANTDSRLQQELADFAAKESALLASQQALAMRESALQSSEQSLATREATLQSSEQQLNCNLSDLEWRERSWQTEKATIAAERDRLRDQLAQLTEESLSQGGEIAAQLADARRELAAQQIAWENEHAQLESERFAQQTAQGALVQERDAIAAKLAAQTETNRAASIELADKLATAEQQLEFQRSAWEGERYQLEVEVRLLSCERDGLSTALTSAGEKLESSRGQSDAASERDELQQKFELALADMQRLRGRSAELEQELASRPAVNQTDSVELVGLRAERDELAHRVSQFERQQPAVVDSDTTQQIAELQRRFELAVEDVRDLKKQNAQLEARVAAAKSTAPVASSPAAKNWEAVKQQLLASLEGDNGDVTPERQKQLSSIENTVRITDEVVATKDRQIAELKTQLASGAGQGGTSRTADGADAIVDADAVIQKHRARIAQIEQEMEDKLRATEMALSMERAKIAREQAQLTELRIELESMRGPNGAIAEPGGSAPKRRWLSKLGLGDEEKK